MRVVLDTNCVVSALIFSKGPMVCLREAWRLKRIISVVCNETVAELIRVLAYPKFRLGLDEIEALLDDYLPWTETAILKSPHAPWPSLRDKADAVFLNLAKESGVDYLASGDRHLQELRNLIHDVRIIQPSEFLVLQERV